MSNEDRNNSDIVVPAIDSAGFKEPLIPAQIIDPATSPIPSMNDSTLSTSTDDSSSSIDTSKKDDAANHRIAMLCDTKESNATASAQPKKAMLLHAVPS